MPSPYINHFLSADTIVPGYANPQNLNRYSYVQNNPIRYADPSGHCIWDLCIVEGIGVVELVLAASSIYAGTVAIEHHDDMAASVTNAIERWQQDNSHRKEKESIAASSGLTADNPNLGPGFNKNGTNQSCGRACKLLIGGLVAAFGCASMFEEGCVNAASKPNSDKEGTPSPTSTPTSTLTSTPTLTITPSPTVTQTSISTRIPRPPQTSTPSRTPGPVTSPWERRADRFLR